MEEGLNKLLEDFEQQAQWQRSNLVRTLTQQPTRVGVSSFGSPQSESVGFSEFAQALPRNIMGCKGVQLLKINVPQASASFGDYELCLFYYRMRTQYTTDGKLKYCELPCIQNLHCIRLLPSYYKPELVSTPNSYGWNKTFDDYQALEQELQKSCLHDLAYDNDPSHAFPFIPGDISVNWNDRLNKFQVTGNFVSSGFTAPLWNPDTLYPKDAIVRTAPDSFYIASAENEGESPVISTNWQVYAPGSIQHTYYIPGCNDPNIAKLAGERYLYEWNRYWTYDVGEIVAYDGLSWVAVATNQGSVPAIGNRDWNPSGEPLPYKLGIKGLSRQWDFELLRSIPPQPSDQSTQNLAVRLGFTWRDTPLLLSQLVTPENYSDGSQATLIFNRLRPIPVYSLSLSEYDSAYGSSPYPAHSTGTITADSWANLVRTSVMYIYTDLLGASTLDTLCKNNLLAIAPMACASLGIGFSGDSVDNKLPLPGIEFNEVRLSFKDEAGQPYVFPSNAIVTCELKMFY